ncbi:MAG: hypothetical protein AAF404_21780, partial [Pseudomonadota bacterium]
ILILAGQAMLGISVLLFDLVWELVLLIGRMIVRFWRWISPLLMRLVPNFIGNFVTRKILPLLADVVPVIKDDHRVMYVRFNSRRHIRMIKAWLYLKSRARHSTVRMQITAMVSDDLRLKKSELLKALTKHEQSGDKKNGSADNRT